MLSITSMPGRTIPSAFTTAALGPARARGEQLETGPYNTAESGWGPHDWSVLSPTGVHRDKRTTLWHAGPFAGGLRGTGRRGTFVEAQHRPVYFNREPTWTPSRPPARQNHTGFGVAVLNCMQEFKNRPFWTAPSGLKRAACLALAALSALQRRPHVPLFENCIMGLYLQYYEF